MRGMALPMAGAGPLGRWAQRRNQAGWRGCSQGKTQLRFVRTLIMDIVKLDCSRLQEVWPCPQELLSSGGQPTNNVAGQL